MTPERIDIIERDILSHAKTITELTIHMSDFQRDKAVEKVRDEYQAERLDRIEDRINAVYKLGWWVLASFGGIFITLVANFVFRGGLYIAP